MDSRDANLNEVMGRALSGSAGFYDALQHELDRRLAEMHLAGASPAEMQAEALQVMLRFVDPLAGLLADAGLAGWYRGAGEVAGLLSPGDSSASERRADQSVLNPVGNESGSPPRMPPGPALQDWDGSPAWLPIISGAVEDLRSRQLVTRPEFDALDDWARTRSFTVADLHTQEALGAVRDAIADAVEQGTGQRQFTQRVTEALGRSALGPGRLENVFRTNVAAAYTAGMDRIAEHPIVQEQFPYEEVMPVRDSRLTSLCDTISRSGINGTAVYRRDDPVYQKYRSPRHYQDRCGRRLLSVRDAAAKGIKEAEEWLRTDSPPATRAWVPEPHLDPEDRQMFEEFRRRSGGIM